jgi:hypothetical protein
VPETGPNAWEKLYGELRQLLASVGTESAYGDGDFWLLDDDWGNNSHKVYVFTIGYLTREITGRVQTLLSRYGDDWTVVFAFDLLNCGQTVATLPPTGLTVSARETMADEGLERLRVLYGEKFRWR